MNPLQRAFTLVEMLVVVAIIAIIISLTLASVSAILRGQEEQTTQRTIKRLDEAITAQVRAITQDANETPIPQSVINIAGGDMRRAKVIWIKLQLKRNFPMTFREALWPWAVDGNPPPTYGPPPGGYPAPIPMNPPDPVLGTGLASPILPTDLPPIKAYVDAIANVASATGQIQGPTYYSPDESSHLLYLSLTLSRRGTKFNAEESIGPVAIYQDPSMQGSLRGFKDSWDQSICFFRWPTDFADNLTATLNGKTDTDDPERTLLDVNWNNAANYKAQAGVYWFEQLCHLVHNPNAATWTPVSYYSPRVIVSGGINKKLGFTQFAAGSGNYVGAFWPPTGAQVTPNFGMALDGTPDSNDNIYSYSIK
jgi:prepilin-type N-terminal cleavage/methylation domain-containing protein